MIEVKGLVKCYGDRKVLHGLNFSVGVGRVCGFLGPNGSGKSTTMDILAGLLGPTDGDIKVCGYDVVTQTKDVKANVGYLPDNPPLYREMQVREFVEYVAKIRSLPASERKSAIERVLTDCDVLDVADRVIGNLSKGYRQRVALCAALVHQPKVLVLDEPTEGLDPNQILHIRNLIKKLAKDRTVILSSHILSEVQATCADVVVIHDGKIAAVTSLSEKSNESAHYVVSLANKADSAASWLKGKDFISEVQPFAEQDNSFVVSMKTQGKDNLVKLSSGLVENGFGLVGLKEHHTGLEALYFDVINKQRSGQTLRNS